MSGIAGQARPRLTLYTREDCELCEHMQQALLAQPEAPGWDIELRDVDADAATRGRYGHKVPVLLLDGELVCHGRLDPLELRKALTARA